MTISGQLRNAFPAYRVFVFGVEVTDDVTACQVNLADDIQAPSTATFTLSNEDNKYRITDDDMHLLYPNDIDPVRTKLPDVREVLNQDPSLFAYRVAFDLSQSAETQLEFIQTLQATSGISLEDAQQLLKRGQSVLARFSEDEYTPALNRAEDDIRTQIKRKLQSIQSDVKRQVLRAKFDKVVQVEQPDLHETGEKQITDLRRVQRLKGQAARYPFYSTASIFHSNDPVRIFMRDPFTPRVWYHEFSGFITDWTRITTASNARSITFTCEDVMRIFRYARLTTNPGIFDIRVLQQSEDFAVRTFFQDDFTNLTLTELLYTLIFGPELPNLTAQLVDQGNLTQAQAGRIRGAAPLKLERYAANGRSSTQDVPQLGVGAFNFERSITAIFGSSTTAPQSSDNEPRIPAQLRRREINLRGKDALGVYQSIVDTQVQLSDLQTMALPGEAFSPSSRIEDVITTIGTNPQAYPVDAGRLIILMPASLGANVGRSILEKDIKGPEMQTTFKNRLSVIMTALQRLEFSFYATGRGDLLVEMPLYDFDPDDFGTRQITQEVVQAATVATSTLVSDTLPLILENAAKNALGPYAPHYRIANRDLGDTQQSFSDEHIRTQMRCAGWNIENLRGTGTATDLGFPPEVRTLRALVPQFGLRLEQADPPTFVTSPQAAAVYAELKLNQWNAEALTSQIDTVLQLRYGPNRPLLIEDDGASYIATCRSVSRSIDWNSRSVSQTTGVNYTRVWDGLLAEDGETPIYAPIGGQASRTINYAALLQDKNTRSLSAKVREKKAALDTFNTAVGGDIL